MDKKANNIEKKRQEKIKEYNKLYLLEIQEREQKRISNELHDTTVQNLTMLIHKAELCEQLADRDIIQTKLELQMMKESLRKTIQELRNIIYNLRPMSVDDLGLTETIERFVSQKEFEEHPMKITFRISGKEPKNIKPIITITILRVIQELFNNAKKHAQCKRFDIFVVFNKNTVDIEVIDDGVGFSKDEICQDGKNFGLAIITERVGLLSGKFNIESQKGNGTKATIEVPIEQEEQYAN